MFLIVIALLILALVVAATALTIAVDNIHKDDVSEHRTVTSNATRRSTVAKQVNGSRAVDQAQVIDQLLVKIVKLETSLKSQNEQIADLNASQASYNAQITDLNLKTEDLLEKSTYLENETSDLSEKIVNLEGSNNVLQNRSEGEHLNYGSHTMTSLSQQFASQFYLFIIIFL